MNVSTANNRLRKKLLFHFAKLLGLDDCYRCHKKIKNLEEFSIEHKESWMSSKNSLDKFFDLDNIAFSHLICNIKFERIKTGVKHPSHRAYNQGCRCDGCKNVEKERRRSQRQNK